MEREPERPPADADDWSDEQWIAWLTASDAATYDDEQATPTTTVARIAHSTGGQILGNTMVGLARALYGQQREKPAIIAETGEPGDDQPFDVRLDFDHPEQSVAARRSLHSKPESSSD